MLETLEPRQLYSGVVTVTTDYGPEHRLLIHGDAAANEVQLTAGFSNVYEEEQSYTTLTVWGGRLIVDGTEIFGGKHTPPTVSDAGSGNIQLYPVGRSPLIDLGDGDDALLLNGHPDHAYPTTEIISGYGNDRINIDGGFAGDLKINASAGDDRVSVRSNLNAQEGVFGAGVSGVRGDLTILTGSGRDRISVESNNRTNAYTNTLLVRGKLRIEDNSGSTQIGMHGVRAKRGVTISTGNAADYLTFKSCIFYSPSAVYTRGGDDVIREHQFRVDQDRDTVFFTGSGRDRFEPVIR